MQDIFSGLGGALIIKLIKNFLTHIQQFDNSYCKNDHFQKRQNQKAIQHYTKVITQKYNKDKKPLSILDYCCGHGIPTFQLTQKLLENKVEISKVVGYDVSKENLSYAIKNNPCKDLIKFQQKNLDTNFSQIQKYDVVVILFGLHWINNIQKAIQNISKSLKPGGIILSLTPIENQQLFQMRTKFMNESRWKNEFENFELPTFHQSEQTYLNQLNKYFKPTRNQVTHDFYQYSTEKMITFFQSWFAQVRHLVHQLSPIKKQIISKVYVTQFVYQIPQNFKGVNLIKNGTKYKYSHPLFFYQGRKL